MNMYTVRFFAKAIKFGSKYVYQTIPRLLTIWLDMGEKSVLANGELFNRLNALMAKAIKETPVYKVVFVGVVLLCVDRYIQWFTAFPQIVSRVGHTNQDVYSNLSKLITMVIQEYPNQALWLFTSVVKSTKPNREQRGWEILKKLQVSTLSFVREAFSSGHQDEPQQLENTGARTYQAVSGNDGRAFGAVRLPHRRRFSKDAVNEQGLSKARRFGTLATDYSTARISDCKSPCHIVVRILASTLSSKCAHI